MTEECLNAAKSLGYPIENDVQNFKRGHGFSVSQPIAVCHATVSTCEGILLMRVGCSG